MKVRRSNLHQISSDIHELIEKLYLINDYEKQYMRLTVTCRYSFSKEYVAFPIIDKEAREIVFVVVVS